MGETLDSIVMRRVRRVTDLCARMTYVSGLPVIASGDHALASADCASGRWPYRRRYEMSSSSSPHSAPRHGRHGSVDRGLRRWRQRERDSAAEPLLIKLGVRSELNR